jgi:hypothetical protein
MKRAAERPSVTFRDFTRRALTRASGGGATTKDGLRHLHHASLVARTPNQLGTLKARNPVPAELAAPTDTRCIDSVPPMFLWTRMAV